MSFLSIGCSFSPVDHSSDLKWMCRFLVGIAEGLLVKDLFLSDLLEPFDLPSPVSL